MSEKPFSETCTRNCWPILEVLKRDFQGAERVLEIGSGTGQHAVFFAEQLPQIIWQTADLPERHEGIQMWITESGLKNVKVPVALDLHNQAWFNGLEASAAYTANTFHIVDWDAVKSLFKGLGETLSEGQKFFVYGPFNYGGKFTAESNEKFSAYIAEKYPGGGIKNYEDIEQVANEKGFQIHADYEMPANNRVLVWIKTGSI